MVSANLAAQRGFHADTVSPASRNSRDLRRRRCADRAIRPLADTLGEWYSGGLHAGFCRKRNRIVLNGIEDKVQIKTLPAATVHKTRSGGVAIHQVNTKRSKFERFSGGVH